MKKFLFSIAVFGCLTSCGLLSNSNDELDDGFYTQRIDGERKKVYINIEDDKIDIYSLAGNKTVDTSGVLQRYPEEVNGNIKKTPSLWERNLDVDFLTVPLKYRPASAGVPPQLNSELNGAAYLGYRVDRYKLDYAKDPLGNSLLETSRFGFSFGAFTGFGNTAMTPTTTNFQIEEEYDGIVWQKGVAAIVGINNFTVGFSFGFDTLLDGNRSVWIYQNKPWIGLALGLNLN